ncbi:hypothetical protein MTAT_14120 [Moorella thermoacetica]|uniref:Inorganic pyrophosphatase domain-containing protein n=1 Tax=Neomoorella thermoacetica TaxID=1525 RepID=A0AAC9HHC1_NEOTH|nr:hypothetical protein [Moorella thermoacetica]AOQ23827.1 hypothetical protein Maut_01379 [Moorella thermoacetica]TYL14012.1 hypothetical protein MTAT_14120 [Moorella thermoacetica]
MAEIIKDALVGFLVVEWSDSDKHGRPIRRVDLVPLSVSYNPLYYDNDPTVDKDDRILGILPAPPNSYYVQAIMPDGSLDFLGLDIPGATHPDWVELAEQEAEIWGALKEISERGIRKDVLPINRRHDC